jgi:REP element-mobilizing transposase RayT
LEHHFSLCSPELSLFDVYYTCLLIPRLKSQSLDGDITDFLKETLPELFLANGWRLEAMDIGPSFLQWMVRIPPTIAPDDHINNIRNQSSRKILGNFTRLNRDELLKDFWAPGYLLGTGKSLFGAEDIIEFIRLNRNHYYPEDGVYNIPGSKFQVNHEKY